MVLELGPAAEADADAIASLHLLAFDASPLLNAQFPTPESRKGLHTFLGQDAIRDVQSPDKALMVVRDSETGRIVSFAKWDLPAPEKHHADVQWPEGCRKRLIDEYYEKAEAARKRAVGDGPCYFLSFVGSDPEYQGRGLGKKLIEWGLAKAKSENIPAYLDSTIPASKVYQKLGFVAVGGLNMTIPGKDGRDHAYEEIAMLQTWGEKSRY